MLNIPLLGDNYYEKLQECVNGFFICIPFAHAYVSSSIKIQQRHVIILKHLNLCMKLIFIFEKKKECSELPAKSDVKPTFLGYSHVNVTMHKGEAL